MNPSSSIQSMRNSWFQIGVSVFFLTAVSRVIFCRAVAAARARYRVWAQSRIVRAATRRAKK